MIPDREQAERLLSWANELKPGVWIDHSRTVARAAETIAGKCGLDANRAFGDMGTVLWLNVFVFPFTDLIYCLLLYQDIVPSPGSP